MHIVPQQPGQYPVAIDDARFGRTNGTAKDLGHLSIRELSKVAQDQGLTGLVRHLIQCLPNRLLDRRQLEHDGWLVIRTLVLGLKSSAD